MEYRTLAETDINRALFSHFIRQQTVTGCWRNVDGAWTVQSDPFVDDWTKEDYQAIIAALRDIVRSQGLAVGAFQHGRLKGFAAVKADPLGSDHAYLDLAYIHVSQDMRGQGIGRKLFQMAKDWAKLRGAKKLYISAHSAVESHAFYRAMGCVEATEYDSERVRREPCDCQLECSV